MALTDYYAASINTGNTLTSGLVVAVGAHRLQNIVNGAAATKVGTVTDAADGWIFGSGSSVVLPDTPLAQYTVFALAYAGASSNITLVSRTTGAPAYDQNYYLRLKNGVSTEGIHKRFGTGEYPSVLDPTSVAAGSLVAAAFSYDGSTQRVYTNGVLGASLAASPPMIEPTSAAQFVTQIGAVDGTERYDNYNVAGIQLVLIWNRALSESEQASLAANPDQVFNLAAADTTAPTLTAPTATVTGPTTATGSVTTTEAGPAWAVMTTTTTTPTAAQIKAGQNSAGAASPAATATLVSGVNSAAFSFTGLTPATGYYLHITQDDTATPANTATPVTAAMVTTDAPPVVITLPALKNNTGTLLANEAGATVHVYAVATGNKVVTKTAQTSDASGVMAVTDAALVAATEYRCVIVLASGAEGLQKATAA